MQETQQILNNSKESLELFSCMLLGYILVLFALAIWHFKLPQKPKKMTKERQKEMERNIVKRVSL